MKEVKTCVEVEDHLFVVVSYWSWRHLFRRTLELRCWLCDFRQKESW